jgi:hypothetical protein
MNMPLTAITLRRIALALLAGLLAFAFLSYLRIQIQYAAAPPPAVGLILTVLMYLLPGCLVGYLVPRSPVISGALLGLLTVAVVWLEVPLRPGVVPWGEIAKALTAFSALGIIVCAGGSGAAAYLRAHWLSANHHLRES